MKIIVDELPNTQNECLFHFHSPATRNGCCKLSMEDDTVHTCQIGSEGFKCPYLIKFKARAFKYHSDGIGITGYTNIPVELLKSED